MNSIVKQLGIAAVVTAGFFAATSGPAEADQRLMCRMKGTWVETKDDFEFDAVYISKDGPDTFTGRYENPSAGAQADIKGVATKGTWLIVLTYVDAKHKGMTKELVGTGSKDPRTHKLLVSGDYKTLIGGSDIKQPGKFTLLGNCK